MQYDENAEKYGYEGEMMPLKCDELKACKGDVYIPVYGSIADADVYLKKDVDAAIAELKEAWRSEHEACEALKAELDKAITERDGNQTAIDELQAENAELKKKLMPCLNGDCILTCEVVEKYGKENAELKQKLESVQASMYADVVDAGMENRLLKRALWLARAERASDKARIFYFAYTCGVELNIDGYSNKEKGHTRMRTARWWRLTWLKVERKCLEKAEEY